MPIPEKILYGTRRDYVIEILIETAEIASERRAKRGVEDDGQRRLLCYTLPPFQRPAVWTQAQQQAFIEGIFLGFGCGYHVATAPDWDTQGNPLPTSRWLIDGQQRITAIAAFRDGTLPIFDGLRWDDLTQRQQINFLREPFPVIEVDGTDDDGRLVALYNRLNYGGTPHPPQPHGPLAQPA